MSYIAFNQIPDHDLWKRNHYVRHSCGNQLNPLCPKPHPTIYLPDIHIVGAMRNVMWKGELGSSIDLDTISDKTGLFGLGPETYLTGEILINDGKCYASTVTDELTMVVEKTFDVSAPFLVYANVAEWDQIKLPPEVKTIPTL